MSDITSLVTASEMAKKIKHIVSAERLLELADSKLIPHYDVDGQIRFGVAETKEWLQHNFVVRHPGKAIGSGIVSVVNIVSPPLMETGVPIELRLVAHLLIPVQISSLCSLDISGVYFLCDGDSIVYVGQSVNVLSRIGSHVGTKDFDRAYFIRVPQSDVNFVEGEFICAIKPKYNKAIPSPLHAEDKRITEAGRLLVNSFKSNP